MHTTRRLAALAALCALSAAWARPAPADSPGQAGVLASTPPAMKEATPPATPITPHLRRHRCAACHSAEVAGSQHPPRMAGQREDELVAILKSF